MVSPQNIATITTSRKPTAANSANSAKLPAPAVARSTSAGRSRLELPDPPSWNANAMMIGSASRNNPTSWVRRRVSWRANSTRSGSVRRLSKSAAAPDGPVAGWSDTSGSWASLAWTPRRVGGTPPEPPRSAGCSLVTSLPDQIQEHVLQRPASGHRTGTDAGGGQHLARPVGIVDGQLGRTGSGHLGHRAGGHQPSPVHHHHVAAGLLDLGQQLRGHDDGAPGGRITAEHHPHHGDLRRVQGGGPLVPHPHARQGGPPPGGRQPPPPAPG